MGKIIEFNNTNENLELTEDEIQLLKDIENIGPASGRHLDIVNAKIQQDNLRIQNGLNPRYNMCDLFGESLKAAILDADEEVNILMD